MSEVSKSMRSPSFGEACRPFINAGIEARALIPIAPPGAAVAQNSSLARHKDSLGKVPGSHSPSTRKWSGLGGPALRDGMTKDDRTRAANWPTGNVGLLGRLCPAIDSDVRTEGARVIVEAAMIETFGTEYAERLRGDGPRRLYALRSDPKLGSDRRVRNGKIRFLMPGETDEKQAHGIDILGTGKQYLIEGIHPHGDRYHWHPDRDLCAMTRANRLARIENGDIERFVAALERQLQAIGGRILNAESGGGGRLAQDHNQSESLAPADRILAALASVPNSEANFPSRDDFVAVMAAIRAFAGSLVLDSDFEDRVRAWAVESSNGWCDDGYFETIWESLHRGQRCGREAFVTILRKHGCHALDGLDFPKDSAEDRAVIAENRAIAQKEERALLDRAAEALVFQHMDTSTGRKSQFMRFRSQPTREFDAAEWWKGRTGKGGVGGLLADLHATFGTAPDKLFDFLDALHVAHPFAFFDRITKNPRYAFGAVIKRRDNYGQPAGLLNIRQWSGAQIVASKPRIDPVLAAADCQHFLRFVCLGFGDGEVGSYILDTLGFMVQTGLRPGHMLIIEGDQKVGKSLFVDFWTALLDGTGDNVAGAINGAKLMNDGSRRFIFGGIEGARVVNIKELPEGSRASDMQLIVSEIKQFVDAGSTADRLPVERKGQDISSIENHAYFVATTNFRNVIPIEEQNRRILPVRFRITQANTPDKAFYDRLGAIMNDPERLAAIWDFLSSRDIGAYDPKTPPPVTREKAAYQIEGIRDPAARHVTVALKTLKLAGRRVFTRAELAHLMNEAARCEFGDDDESAPYSAGRTGGNGFSTAAEMRLKEMTEDHPFKSGSTRFPRLYAFKDAPPLLAGAKRGEAFDTLRRDRRKHPVHEMLPVEPYEGPLHSPMPEDDDREADREDDHIAARGAAIALDWDREDDCPTMLH